MVVDSKFVLLLPETFFFVSHFQVVLLLKNDVQVVG